MSPEKIDPRASAGSSGECGELLSCLLDGELDEKQCEALIERLRRDDEACRRWALLNCAGDALRSSDVAAWHSAGFVARVTAALRDEPTVLAPVTRPARSRLRRWALPGAGAAAAAALLVAIGVPTAPRNEPDALVARAPATAPVVAAIDAPVRIDRSPALERYLAAHRELAEPSLMLNATPYLRTSGALYPQEAR
jgi:negative regulator of sigma E activity